MGTYLGAAPLSFYTGAGDPLGVYTGAGQPLSENTGPPPSAPSIFGYAANEFPERNGWWWDKLANAATTPTSVLLATNSIGAGYIASSDGSVDLAQFRANGYVGLTRTDLGNRLGEAGEGVIALTDDRVTTTGSPAVINGIGVGAGAVRLTAGKTMTMTGARCGARLGFNVAYEAGVTAWPTVLIDGVAQTTPTLTGANGAYLTAWFSVSPGTHTIKLIGVGQADVSVFVAGTHTLSQVGTPGGYVYNVFPTATAGPNAFPDGPSPMEKLKATLDAFDVDNLGLAFTQNEATYEQNLGVIFKPSDVADRYDEILDYQINTRGKGGHIVAGPARTGVTGTYTMDNYWDAQRALVNGGYPQRCEFLDFRTRTGSAYDPAKFVDSVHPNRELHDLMHRVYRDSMFPTGAALMARRAQAA